MSEERHGSLKERWDWVISFMVMEDLFVHEILLMMDKSPSKNIPTMGVAVKDARIKLYYNEDFVSKLSDAELRFVLTHEVYHLVLHHCTKRAPEDPKQARIWNMAADMAINTLIPVSADRTPPVDEDDKVIGVYPKDQGFPDKLSMENYLSLMEDKYDDSNGDGDGGGDGVGGDGSFDDHSMWDESDVIDQMVKEKVEQLSRSGKVWGSMSGDMQEIIKAAQKSQVPWTRILRHYLGNIVSPERRPSFKKPNRRYPYPYCGSIPKSVDKKLVAIDTSASVGSKELAQFLTEVNKLCETNPVDVCLFDTEITQEPMPFDKRRREYDFKGRGGTDFSPVMMLAEEKRYTSVIMLTDGMASAPERPRYVKDVIWVLVGTANPPVEWGKVVRVTPSI